MRLHGRDFGKRRNITPPCSSKSRHPENETKVSGLGKEHHSVDTLTSRAPLASSVRLDIDHTRPIPTRVGGCKRLCNAEKEDGKWNTGKTLLDFYVARRADFEWPGIVS